MQTEPPAVIKELENRLLRFPSPSISPERRSTERLRVRRRKATDKHRCRALMECELGKVLEKTGISEGARVLYAVLWSFAFSRGDWYAEVRQVDLAVRLGIAEREVRYRLRELIAAGLLDVEVNRDMEIREQNDTNSDYYGRKTLCVPTRRNNYVFRLPW